MGGTIALLAEQGHDVLLVDVTDGSPTPRGDRASRLVEAAAALAELQPSAKSGGRVRRVLLDFKNREVRHTIELRHALAGVYRAHRASVVFVPQMPDAHPDHRAVREAAWDARFDAKLTKVEMPVPIGFDAGPPVYPRWVFGYDVSHLRGVMRPDFIIDITGFERKKQASVRAYASQFGAPKPGETVVESALVRPEFPERLLWQASELGAQIGVAYGEGFWSPEPLGLRGLSGVLGIG